MKSNIKHPKTIKTNASASISKYCPVNPEIFVSAPGLH